MGRKGSRKLQKTQSTSTGKKTSESNLIDVGSMQIQMPNSDLICCKQSEVYGRYLEARTLIRKGTLIFSENVLVCGPMRLANICCVGCHLPIQMSSDPVKVTVQACAPSPLKASDSNSRCSKCFWPICSDRCMNSRYHQSECAFFVENKIQVPEFDISSGEFGALTVLRALLLKITHPAAWAVLNTLEHHNDARRKLPMWAENQSSVVDVIQSKWKLRDFFTEEEIHTVSGILEVNSFELGDKHSFRGLFPQAAMLAHNCVPNVSHFLRNQEGKMDIRAAVDIPSGTPLFLTYALSLQGTDLRRECLMSTKFFACTCARCNDPTELGTNLSSLKCQNCVDGWVLKDNCSENWLCNNSKCRQRFAGATVDSLIKKFYSIWENLVGIKNLERFLNGCESYFHPNHFIPFRPKFDLAQAYGREGVSTIHELSDADLARKLFLCTEVLTVLDKVTPGHTITRGLILYELQAAELMISKRTFEDGHYEKSILRKRLVAAMKSLLEAITILSYSEPSTMEYEMAKRAKRETLPALQNWIDCLH